VANSASISRLCIYDLFILFCLSARNWEGFSLRSVSAAVQPMKQAPAHARAHNTNVRISLNSQKRNVLKKFISSHIFKQFQSALFHTFLSVTAKPHANLLHVPSNRRGLRTCWQQTMNFTFSFETWSQLNLNPTYKSMTHRLIKSPFPMYKPRTASF